MFSVYSLFDLFLKYYQETLDKIASRKWDVVVLQEQSQRPAFDEDRVCRNTVEPLNTLVEKIKESSPNAKIQVFLGL